VEKRLVHAAGKRATGPGGFDRMRAGLNAAVRI
jgi:hypothetical protein